MRFYGVTFDAVNNEYYWETVGADDVVHVRFGCAVFTELKDAVDYVSLRNFLLTNPRFNGII